MKKQLFFLAVAALALASCSSENDVVQTPAAQQTADDGAVLFDSYVNRSTTRAGETGALKTADLRNTETKLGKAGFGVFGYYTNNATYDQQAIPNFFYNEKVWWNGRYFEYNPIKYWPNEYGKTAESEDNDKVTFFAYAPWVEVSPSTGKAIQKDASNNIDQEASAKLQKWGITTLSNNSATGDPLVKYLVSFDQDKSVDLCWGVCDGTDTQWNTVESGSTNALQTLTAGLPWLDVQRPAEAKTQADASQRVRFTFKHATAQLMVKINAFVDGTDNSNPVDGKTKVYVRSITFEGFATKGALNLNNTETGANKAYWMDWTGSNDIVTGESVTIYDGRKDGKEGTPSGEATNEKTLGLNPDLVQSEGWESSADGVTHDLKNLFRKWNPTGGTNGTGVYEAADKPIYVIPTGDDVRVTITYDIETEDEKLSTYVSDVTTHGSSIENVISKNINFGSNDLTALENGKSYVINLHLGMNSVKFDATVTEWVDAETTPDVDLPANVPQFAASSTETYTVELPATTTLYTFAITGLNGGEAVTAPTVSSPFSAPTANAANSSGVAIESISIAPNLTPKDKDAVDYTWTGKSSGKVAKMSFVQKAHALELKIKSVSGKVITLDAGASGIVWGTDVDATTLNDGEADEDDAIKVWRNGSRLIFKNTASADGQFTYNNTPDKIGLGTAPVPGETYTIYVKAGDAEGETVTFRVGGPSLSSAPVTLEYGETYTRKPVFYGADGVAEPSYTWSPASGNDYISVNENSGEVKTLKVTTTDQTVTLTTPDIPSANGWVYDTSDKTYKVEVKKATATFEFTEPTPENKTGIGNTAGSEIITNPVILKNSKGTKLTPGNDKGGNVEYTIVSATKVSGTDVAAYIKVDNEGKVTVKNTLDTNTEFIVEVKATVTSNDNADYGSTTEKTFTIRFKTVS